MRRKSKKILKFIVECSAVSLVVFVIFFGKYTYGNHRQITNNDTITSKETSIQQENTANTENTENKTEEKSTPTVLTKEQLTEKFNVVVNQYVGNNTLSVVYKNMKNNYTYNYNENQYYTAASTTKVMYAMYVYDRINNGELTGDTQIAYNSSMLQEGGGEITNQPKKSSYSLDYTLMNMIKFSDNTATQMIVGNSTNAANIKVKLLNKLGIKLPYNKSMANQVTPAMMLAVWENLYNNQKSYSDLLTNLKESDDHEAIKEGISNKDIASKYGALNTNMHDTAIVFGNSDYILIIYSNNLAHAESSLADIAKQIDDITNNNM